MPKPVNPFRKRVCPACSEEYYPGNCAIVSSLTNPPYEVLQEARPGTAARAFVTPLDGPKFARKLALRQCPHCGSLLPRDAESYTIAIVGDSSSGKSHYIASCIHQLKQYQALQVIGCSAIIGQGTTDERYNRDYYEPVYRRGKQLMATPRATNTINEPLVYELVFQERSALQPAKNVNLLFYDSSGEDMVSQKDMVVYSHYILNASAIIFLADPQQMPGIVKSLPEHLKPGLLRPLSTSEVLNRVIQTFRTNLGISPGKKLKTPIAITVSKSDLLRFAVKGAQPPLFLSETVYYNQLDLPKFEYVSQEVQFMLQSIGDQVLLKASDLFENASFFAVSATGWPPDQSGEFPPLEPVRCLDPLLWSLWKLGIISMV